MLANLHSPFFFAHRGASAHAPENTLAAFELAYQQGAPAIELDVSLTSDRQVIVIHDNSLDRTTNGHGRIKDQPLAALRDLDAGAWFGPQFKGEKIPTLEQVFEAVGKKLFINVELKNYSTPSDGLTDEVVKLVLKHNLADRILFSSFLPTNLTRAAKLLPQTPRGQLMEGSQKGWWQRLAANFMSLQAENPHHKDVTAGMVKLAHARHRRILTWTVDDPAEMRRLRALGVDAIITDDPLLAKENFL
jgi:glycerophosphoryl diester phosphodiesterase